MAASFIESLPNVGRGVLDKENQQCCLCREEYGTEPSTRGIIERPVKLPCDHIIGSECITLWLTTGGGNSCPMCRRIFFPRQGPEDSQGEEDDGGDTMYEILDVADFDINNRDQYLQLRRATPSLSAPPDFTREMADHISRRDRERVLYSFLQYRNHDAPELEGNYNTELGEHHLNFLFKDLEERGMFNELWGDSVTADTSEHGLQLPTRRDMWDLMRDLGYHYEITYRSREERGRGWWCRTVWYPRGPSGGGRPRWMADDIFNNWYISWRGVF